MKRAIIIGATSGIGEEVAKLLIQQGWHIPFGHNTYAFCG